MPAYQHYGLFFSADQVKTAQNQQNSEPFHAAWEVLNHPPANDSDTLNKTFIHALRYRLNDDLKAGADALRELQNGIGLDPSGAVLHDLMRTVTLAQIFELISDHPEFSGSDRDTWLRRFAQHIEHLNQTTTQLSPESSGQGLRATSHSPLLPTLWQGLVNLCAGIVLESDSLFEAGAQAYRETIDRDIRPEGYLPHAVEGEDGGSLERQLLAVAALTLMAEAARHVNVDLWGYSSRGISAITANLYCIYYYYYPDQWRWDTVTEAQSTPLYQALGGFFEIFNQHTRTNDLKLMFEALRPFYNPAVGGLTTLTHAVAGKRKLFGS